MSKARLYESQSVVVAQGETVSLRVPPLSTVADRVVMGADYRAVYLQAIIPHLQRAGVSHIMPDSFLWFSDINCYQARDFMEFEIWAQQVGGRQLAERQVAAFKLGTWEDKIRPWSYEILPFPVGAKCFHSLLFLTRDLHYSRAGILLSELIGCRGQAPHLAGVLLFGNKKEQAHLRHGLELACSV